VDCFFDNNQAPFAAGLFIRQSDATVSGCTFQNNATQAGGSGGGIEITDCSADIIDCLIVNNMATGGSGGGLFYENCPSGTLIDCVIMGNAASPTSQFGAGGGIKLSSSGIEITNVLIVDNYTGPNGFGGGAYVEFGPAPVFTNVTFANNSCAGGPSANGGGLYCDWFSAPVVDKCIIAFSSVGEGMFCNLANGGSAVVSCTDVFGNAGGDALCGTDMGGNFSLDPLFCGTVGFEYNLQTGSPCIPGNHPGGPTECGGDLIGAMPEGCSANPVNETPETTTQLLGNAPNPFNPSTTIFFVLAEPGPATLRVFDLRGRLITSFHWSELPPGRSQVEWNGKDLAGHDMPSGVYLYQLEAHNIVQTQRMSLIR
jgi:predicted outer membrane repeat protein